MFKTLGQYKAARWACVWGSILYAAFFCFSGIYVDSTVLHGSLGGGFLLWRMVSFGVPFFFFLATADFLKGRIRFLQVLEELNPQYAKDDVRIYFATSPTFSTAQPLGNPSTRVLMAMHHWIRDIIIPVMDGRIVPGFEASAWRCELCRCYGLFPQKRPAEPEFLYCPNCPLSWHTNNKDKLNCAFIRSPWGAAHKSINALYDKKALMLRNPEAIKLGAIEHLVHDEKEFCLLQSKFMALVLCRIYEMELNNEWAGTRRQDSLREEYRRSIYS